LDRRIIVAGGGASGMCAAIYAARNGASVTIIEKNNQSIAMMKILGFSQFEINRAYNLSTGIVVLISEIISIPIDAILLKVVWEAFMKVRMKGWITFYLAPWIYFAMFGIGIGSFLIVFLIEHFKTKKIPLSLALKRE